MQENITKKQHYVPQMYLRNFSSDKKRVYVYDSVKNEIRLSNIRDICEQNYIYEVRNDKGEFVFPQTINLIEKTFSKVEAEDSAFLGKLLEKIENNTDSRVILSKDEHDSLLGFSLLMVIRNPIVKSVLPEALQISSNLKISTNEEITLAWLMIMTMIEKGFSGIENSRITFLKTTLSTPFITSELPVYFSGNPLQKDFYMPLSSTIAIELGIPDNALIDIYSSDVKNLIPDEVDLCNGKILTRDQRLISNSREWLERNVSFMNDFDNEAINPYTIAHLRLFENMGEWEFFEVTKKFSKLMIFEEKSELFNNKYQSLMKSGINSEESIELISKAIANEFRKIVICNKKPSDELFEECMKGV